MAILKLKYNPQPAISTTISDQELIKHIAQELPELPVSLTMLIERFDKRACGLRMKRDALSRIYLSSGPH